MELLMDRFMMLEQNCDHAHHDERHDKPVEIVMDFRRVRRLEHHAV